MCICLCVHVRVCVHAHTCACVCMHAHEYTNVCVPAHAPYVCKCPWHAETCIGCSETGVTGSCKLSDMGAGDTMQVRPLRELKALSTAEPSLQALLSFNTSCPIFFQIFVK